MDDVFTRATQGIRRHNPKEKQASNSTAGVVVVVLFFACAKKVKDTTITANLTLVTALQQAKKKECMRAAKTTGDRQTKRANTG
jgi:hypothetical protein